MYLLKKTALVSIALIISVGISASVLAVRRHNGKPDYSGVVLTVGSAQDLSVGSFYEGAKKFEEKYGCTVVFADPSAYRADCDLFFSDCSDFSGCLPLDDYVSINNKLYTKQIIKDNCTRSGKIYGITNVLLGNINYCAYSPDLLGSPLPFDSFKKGDWSWDKFIEMSDAVDGNVAVDWSQSYINMRYALSRTSDGETVFDYGSRRQVEWLNFVRTLIYDKGIVNNTEGAFKIDFLPALAYSAAGSDAALRYIPLPTKSGRQEAVFVEEYCFCVPQTAENPGLSVKLANCMIKSCVETRTELYRSVMTDEDFKIFEKQLKNICTLPFYAENIPAESFIEDFIHGKTVTEHIYNIQNDAAHIE